MKKLITWAVLGAIAMASYFALRSRATPDHPPGAAAKKELADVEEPRRIVVEHVVSMTPSASAALSARSAIEARPDDVEVAPAEFAQRIEDAFAMEPPSDRDARRMSSSIAAAFRLPAAEGALLENVECRGTRCRLQISFDDAESDRRVARDMFDLLASSGVDTHGLRFVIPTRSDEPNGKVKATLHLFRGDS